MPLPNRCDIVIIGGGIAASMAAYTLAKFGYEVVLIERELSAHHKVCGEYMSPEMLPYFSYLGIDLDALGAAKISGIVLHSEHFQRRLNLQHSARSLSRYILDEACLKQAMLAGCHLYRGITVENLSKVHPDASFKVETSHGRIECQTVFLATGKHTLKGIPLRDGREHSAIAFKLHLNLSAKSRQLLGQDIALFLFKGGYAGLSAVESGHTNLCFIVRRERFKESGNSFESILQLMKADNLKFNALLDASESLWPRPLAMTNIPYGYLLSEYSAGNMMAGLFPIGDQLAVIPSLTGSGMAIALYTAHQAALYYHAKRNNGVSDYVNNCRDVLAPRMRLAYPMHAITQNSLMADMMIAGTKIFPAIIPYFHSKTRIPAMTNA